MKKMVEKEMTFCVECEKGDYVYKCMGCGIEYCYDCRKLLLKEYHHGVYFTGIGSGSGDGYFCKDCDINPPVKVKKIHSLYKAVEMLKNEVSGYYKEFEIRYKVVEKDLRKNIIKWRVGNENID